MKGLRPPTVLAVFCLFCVVYAGALFVPAVIFVYFIVDLITEAPLELLAASALVVVDVILFLLMAVPCSGAAARILHLKYSGEHDFDFRNQQVRKWLYSLTIYLPTAVVLDFFHLYPLKSLHIKLFGGKVARGVVMGAPVTDPALLQVGEYSVIGGFSTILGHAVEHGKIKFGAVSIGENCTVGVGATVLPGAVLEDGSTLAAQSLLPKNAVMRAGRTHAGVPVRGTDSRDKERADNQ